MTKRAAIYARFSSDHQTERSITDQVGLCRAYAARQGWSIVDVYSDSAISGETVHGRLSYARMIADAKAGKFDTILAEDIDRISRNIADIAQLRDRMEFIGVEIQTVADGLVTPINAMLKGFTSAEFLRTHRLKVRRGAAGNIREGKHAGGLAYGYRATPGKPGVWVIHEAEAEIVRRIFQEYVAGDRSAAITGRLNAEGIKPPRGAYWRAGTLTGTKARGSGGIIGNDIYAGHLVWNKTRMVKNPDTGKRISRSNPEAEWHRHNVPHLRIVDQETFAAAQAIRAERGRVAPTFRRKPRHMLSGLLRCGVCSAGMSVKGVDRGGTRVICTSAHENACAHRRSYYLHNIERTILGGLRDHLRDPRAIKAFLSAYHEERRRLSADSINMRSRLERELAEVERKLDRAVNVMLDSTEPVNKFTAVISGLEKDKSRMQAELAATAEPVKVVALHPAAVTRYLEAVEDVAAALRSRRQGSEFAETVRELIHSATVMPTEPGTPMVIDVEGRLTALTGAPVYPSSLMSGGKVVAEEGLEPPTHGL